MLLKLGDNIITKKRLPKLNVNKSSTVKNRRKRIIVDDSASVKITMDKLFKDYDWKVVTAEAELLSYLRKNKELGIDTETTGLDLFKSKLVGISFGTINDCIYIPLNHKKGKNYEGDISIIQNELIDTDIYGFNVKFDMKALKLHLDISIEARWCGYLAARLINSAEPANDLKSLYLKYIDVADEAYAFKKLFNQSFDMYDPEIVGGYAAVDALKHIRLAKWQQENIDKEALKLLTDLEMPLTHDLVDIELRGVQLDLKWANELISILELDLSNITKEINADYPDLNPGSPKQVANWLYDKLKLPMIQGRGTGEAILNRIDHPLAQKVLEYRAAQKSLSTYAKKMPEQADNEIIHATFNQYGADTGRFSSSDPNLQNIPRDIRFRKMFRAREGHTLVSCDYSQQEVYILASLAKDELMIQAYSEGKDFYAFMASIVFNKPYEECVKGGLHGELRDQMKSVVLGLNYDMGIASLARDIGKTIAETKDIYNRFFEACPRIKTFRQERVDFAMKYGYVETILKRKRRLSALHLPDFESDNKPVEDMLNTLKNDYAINNLINDAKKEGIKVIDRRNQKVYELRQVVNSAVQGSAADMTKLAIIVANKDEELKKLGCQILMQIHDEIIAEFPDETAIKGGERLAEILADVGTDLIDIQMNVKPEFMKSWGIPL